MYGHPFLLKNLPPTDSAPLADYLPYLCLLWELLREHADQILPHPSEGPITISIKPGDLALLQDLRPSMLVPQWTCPHLVILTTPTTIKLNGIPQWQHLSRIKHCPPTSDSSTTRKDEYSCVPLGPMRLHLSCISSYSSSGSRSAFPLQPRNNPPVTHACALQAQEVLLLRLYCSTLTIPVQARLSGHALTMTPSIKCAPMIINLPASTPLIALWSNG
jgi:hypothetical protein